MNKKNCCCFYLVLIGIFISCATPKAQEVTPISDIEKNNTDLGQEIVPVPEVKKSNIDLSHWKVTLPIGDPKPINVNPPEIIDYENVEVLKKYMYTDTSDESIVFYTTPGITTTNTKYSRTELREQMVPGKNDTNWTFEQGGKMKATLAVEDISKDEKGKYDRVIILQIHGRLTNQQRDLIGKSDNDAPPIMKVYWDKGRIRLKSKYLKDHNASDTEILQKTAWGDDEGYNFPTKIDLDEKFTIEISASKGKMVVTLNDKYKKVYKGIDMEKWNVFENYFKAGNYLQSVNPKSFSKVKFYDLEVIH